MMAKIKTDNLNLWYGNFQALQGVNITVSAKRITSIIGPSGCGKSTLLRVFNRMNDLVEGIRITGAVFIDNINIITPDTDLVMLRKKVGMVFQRPNPFPLSIYENIAFGERVHADSVKKSRLDEIVELSLRSVLLWDELKDKLRSSALGLSLEQKQRLCIARLIAVRPDILLMDEPCSTLDPQATSRIEELMHELKNDYTIIIVTHNMQQAARISDDTGFMLLGELIEFGRTEDIFTAPKDKRTEDYITGRYG
jgi:phosphate transport system ATP-binding protein